MIGNLKTPGSPPKGKEVVYYLSCLATFPLGRLLVFDGIKPQSGQTKDSDQKDKYTRALQECIENEVTPQLADRLETWEEKEIAALEMHILFCLPSKAQEKDLDNMTKWFWDEFKAMVDDAKFSELRVVKRRFEHRDEGLIAVTVSSAQRDISDYALMWAGMAKAEALKNLDDSEIEQIRESVETLRDWMTEIVPELRSVVGSIEF